MNCTTIIEHHHNALGVSFNFDTEEEQALAWSGNPKDNGEAYIRNRFYATGFKFKYKGALISGSLPRIDAGYSESRFNDDKFTDLLPALQAACGFPIDMGEVEPA